MYENEWMWFIIIFWNKIKSSICFKGFNSFKQLSMDSSFIFHLWTECTTNVNAL